jgi:hypothetical protein
VLLSPFNSLLSYLGIALVGLEVFALVDALVRPGAGFPAVGKLTKPIWVAILAVAVVFSGFVSFAGLLGVVAVLVYLLDVRPALRRLTG